MRMGNFAPRPKEAPQRKIEEKLQEAAAAFDPLEHCELKTLEALTDDVEEDTLQEYRRKRLAELRSAHWAAKFGHVLQVFRTNFVREVTDASADGQWVLCLLSVDALQSCQIISAPWEEAARKFPSVKFMRGVASEVVENFPDDSVPAVFIYRNKECAKQIIGLNKWGGNACNVDCIEWVLAQENIVKTELERDPRKRQVGASSGSGWKRIHRRSSGDYLEDGEDDLVDDDRCYSSTRIGDGFARRS